MAKKKSIRGGARARSGRKPVEDPKLAISIYVQQSLIEKIGREHAREIMLSAVLKEAARS